MTKKTENQQIVADDILRYKKNKLAQGLALLGLVFNCLYFLVLYAQLNAEFKKITIGFSVILTLIVLLLVFLSSEGVKGYNKKYSIVLLVIAVFQILRIFYYPLKGVQDDLLWASGSKTVGYFGIYPTSSSFFFTIMVLYLVLSAACFIASAVWGGYIAIRLEKFQKKLDSGEINVEETLKAMDAEEEANAVAQAVEPTEEVQTNA